MSISNIVAMALLSGSPHCPPVGDVPSAVAAADKPATVQVQLPAPLQASDDASVGNASIAAGADILTLHTSSLTNGAQVRVQPPVGEPTVVAIDANSPLSSDALRSVDPATPVVADENTIIVTARTGPPPGDPVEAVNEVSFVAAQAVDEAIVAPVAQGYEDGLPEPIRDGIYNVINNLDEPIVFLNFLLQLKIGKALETVGRFAINSTVGVAGLFDVAKKKPFNLPRRPNGLANTLGFYGVGPGPYLYLPLVGSTTIRDLVGRVVDLSLVPNIVGKPLTNPLISTSKGVLSSIDERVRNDEILTRVQQSGNPYAAMREYYLKKRQAEIDVLRGKRCDADINLADLEFMDSLPAAEKKPVVQSIAPQKK